MQVRVELIEHAMGQRSRVEDRVAAVHHVIVERQHHERGVGDDAVEDARIHRVKIRRFGVNGLAQTRKRFFSGENGGFTCIGHSHCTRVLRQKAQIEQLLGREGLCLGIIFGGGIDHQLHAFYG